MKKFFKGFTFNVICVLTLMIAFTCVSEVKADSNWYSDVISTYVVTDAGRLTPDIAGVKDIQQIVFFHATASTETYKIYELSDSTTTVNLIGTVYLPAVAGIYPVFGDGVVLTGNPLTGEDWFVVDDIFIRHDNGGTLGDITAYCGTDTVQILYK